MDVSELLHPYYPVGSASYCMLAATFEMARESHTIEAMIRSCHIYKEIWCADVGEELSCVREAENYHNPFAVAVLDHQLGDQLID